MGSGSYKYKYCYGKYTSREAAKDDLAEARKSFKDAYVIKFRNGAVVNN
jgi:hypothetical protein